MTLLQPGTFRVSDHRKPIPDSVVKIVLKRYRRDHRPPLEQRPFDTESNDFIPAQHDPNFIDLILVGEHDKRTFGRAVGATKTVTTRGSDAGNAALDRHVRDQQRMHSAKMAEKSGDRRSAKKIRAGMELKSNQRPKRKIRSRGFQPGHRPLRSRNDLRRRKP